MKQPAVRFTRPRATETLTVDYETVLRQAVDNERWRVLREVRRAVDGAKATKPKGSGRYDWDTEPRTAAEVLDDLRKVLDGLESTSGSGS